MAEFVTVTCLCEEMLQLSEPLKAAYDEVDVSVMEQLISQYVVSTDLVSWYKFVTVTCLCRESLLMQHMMGFSLGQFT